MSSFKITARHKQDGTLHEVWCLDDFYGRHNYGYIICGSGKEMNEEDFYNQYEPVEPTHE